MHFLEIYANYMFIYFQFDPFLHLFTFQKSAFENYVKTLPLRSGRSKKWHVRKELYMGNFLSKNQKGSNFSDI